MISFNLKDPNPPIKVFLENVSKNAAFVMLRPATTDILESIRKDTHLKRFKNVKGIIHEYFDIDEDLYDLRLWEYCMPGWGNIKDENGNEIKYSPKKAVWLLHNTPYFSNLIGEKMEEVSDIIEKRAMAVEKN